jgi:peptide/nickel transport system permease protein/oligopeptide transport system permease protein
VSATLASERAPLARPRSLSWRIFGGRPDPVLIVSFFVLVVFAVCAIAPGLVATHDPLKIGPDLLQGPSGDYWFGTDEYGRDIYSRIVHGARIELVISALGVGLAMLLGIPLGLVAGYRGGWIDSAFMRVQDAILAFPSVLFAILVVAAQGASQRSIILTVGVIFLPRFARLVRASVMALKEEDFVTASRSVGARDARVIVRHILPNALPSIMVQVTLTMAVAILIEAGLSYLGLGVQPPTATWGTMLKSAQSYPSQAPWYVLAPGISIFLLVLALNLFGDGLRDRLDPRTRRL